MSAGFQNIQEPHDVTFRIGTWVFQRVTDASLGGQVHHSAKIVLFEDLIDFFLIGQIGLNEAEIVKVCQDLQSITF